MRGRYYFSPPGTPFYPGWHHLGSSDWYDNNNRIEDPPVGEAAKEKHRWDTGARPVYLPLNVIAGSTDCLGAGASLAGALPQELRLDGFPLPCWGLNEPPNVDFQYGASVWRCQVQLFWATRIYEMYEGKEALAVSMLLVRFRDSTVFFREGTQLFPPYMLIRHPKYAIAILLGTQNYDQVLVQVLATAIGPTDIGNFSTGLLWKSFADRVLGDLTSIGVTDNRPLLFTGHSYGGASAMLCAAIARRGQNGRYVRYLTFGAPKPGDGRLAAILREHIRGLSIVNTGDVIGALPPDLDTIAAVAPILGLGSLLKWADWVYPPESALQGNGKLRKNEYQGLTTKVVVDTVRHAIATGSLFGFPRHVILAYIREIEGRCPIPTLGVAWSALPPALYAWGRIQLLASKYAWGKIFVTVGLTGWDRIKTKKVSWISVGQKQADVAWSNLVLRKDAGRAWFAFFVRPVGWNTVVRYLQNFVWQGPRVARGDYELLGLTASRPSFVAWRYGHFIAERALGGVRIARQMIDWTSSRYLLGNYKWTGTDWPRGDLELLAVDFPHGVWRFDVQSILQAGVAFEGALAHGRLGLVKGYEINTNARYAWHSVDVSTGPMLGLSSVDRAFGAVEYIGISSAPPPTNGAGILAFYSDIRADQFTSAGQLGWWSGEAGFLENCMTASPIALGEVISTTFRPGQRKWFKFATAGNAMMHVDFVQVDGSPIACLIQPGSACVSFGPGQGTTGVSMCLEADATGWPTMYVVILCIGPDNGKFSIVLEDGPC